MRPVLTREQKSGNALTVSVWDRSDSLLDGDTGENKGSVVLRVGRRGGPWSGSVILTILPSCEESRRLW